MKEHTHTIIIVFILVVSVVGFALLSKPGSQGTTATFPGNEFDGADRAAQGNTTGGECVRSGCGGMDCVDASQFVEEDESCVIQPHFACFDAMVCERQASGECDWTQTDEFSSCMIGHLQGLDLLE